MNAILNKSLGNGNNKQFWKYIKARLTPCFYTMVLYIFIFFFYLYIYTMVFTMDDDTDHLPTMSHPKYPNIENINISIEGVEKLLDNISIHKASGPDKIPNSIHKTCSKEISTALANIFQQS